MQATRRQFLQQLGYGAAGLGFISFLPGCASTGLGGRGFARSAPEAQGIASAGILDFLEAVHQSTHEFHSLMIARHGHVVAEGWWSPYGAGYNHTMYSMSKSFTSTAVGFAISEGRLKVTDPVQSFFPGELPGKPSEHLSALRVKDLLTMSVGQAKDSTGFITKEENWVKTFLALPIEHAPGTTFLYNSGATYMLSAIVQQVTGQKVIDYLRPRLFEPLGIDGMTWETCPRGINTGGWGLSIQTEGLARFGQMYLQKGAWQGRQIIPAAWVEEATSFKIQQPAPAKPQRPNADNDWLQGYCYQFWRCRHHAFRGDGAFGQYTIVMPDQDAVIAVTSETSNMQGELDLVWKHLLPAMKAAPLPVDRTAQSRLGSTLADLALAPIAGQNTSATGARLSGKTFKIDPNDLGIQSVTLRLDGGACIFSAHDAQREHAITCGMGEWRRGETAMPGTPPRLLAGGAPRNRTPVKVAASAAWKDGNTLAMQWRFNETPHHDLVQCEFDADRVKISFTNSIVRLRATKDSRPILTGQLV